MNPCPLLSACLHGAMPTNQLLFGAQIIVIVQTQLLHKSYE